MALYKSYIALLKLQSVQAVSCIFTKPVVVIVGADVVVVVIVVVVIA